MAKLQPKKELDAEILKEIIKYYRINQDDPNWDPDDYLEWECFSHPSLELHECNCRSRLPGGHLCEHCDHIVGKPCAISCDFQNFCLAVFAWRMGIGGSDFQEAIKHNLYFLTPEQLYDEVIMKFSLEDVDLTDSISDESEHSIVNVDVDFIRTLEQEKSVAEKKEIKVKSSSIKSEDNLLSISEAAAVYGCTYANIYNYVKEGRLESIVKNRRMFVKREDLLDFKDKARKVAKK